jgi:hypothetical protein
MHDHRWPRLPDQAAFTTCLVLGTDSEYGGSLCSAVEIVGSEYLVPMALIDKRQGRFRIRSDITHHPSSTNPPTTRATGLL